MNHQTDSMKPRQTNLSRPGIRHEAKQDLSPGWSGAALSLKTKMNTRPELNYDGCGINGPDEYRTRIATFSNLADHYGPMFAASPDMLAILKDTKKWLNQNLRRGTISAGTANQDGDLVTQINAAISRAEGRTA